MKPRLALIFLALLLTVCSSVQERPNDNDHVEEEEVNEPAAPPSYVLARPYARLYLDESDRTEFVQWFEKDHWEEVATRWSAEDRDALERFEEREVKRRERFEKREDTRRKRERRRRAKAEQRAKWAEARQERLANQRRGRAERHRKLVRDNAQSRPESTPELYAQVFRIVDESDAEWLLVETPGFDPDGWPHCYEPGLRMLASSHVRFWVHRSELFETLTTRTRVPIMEGTEVVLHGGVALDPRGNYYLATVDGVSLELQIPRDSISYKYRPTQKFAAPFTDTVFSPEALSENALQFSPSAYLTFNAWREYFITQTLHVGRRFYATTQTPCAELTVLSHENDLEPAGPRGVTHLSEDSISATRPLAIADTTLYNRQGKPVGRTFRAQSLGREVQGTNGRRCFEMATYARKAYSSNLVFCIDPQNIDD